MTRTKSSSLAGEVVRIDHALLTSLKSIRTLAEKCRTSTADAAAKEQLEKYLARPHPMAKPAPIRIKKDKPTEADRRHRKIIRMMEALTEEQLRIVTDVAKSMNREPPNRKRKPSPPGGHNETGTNESQPRKETI